MKFGKIAERLSGLGSEKWAVHIEGRKRAAAGEKMIFLSIGEPDAAPPEAIFEVARKQMGPARVHYSDGRGEPVVRNALSRHYTKQTGRTITPDRKSVV